MQARDGALPIVVQSSPVWCNSSMIVPSYWSESVLKNEVQGRSITVRRFGWSNDSESAALEMAESRAQEAMARIQGGETLGRREPKVPYNGADGVPIREQVVHRDGDTVITRNSYGALCLNTPNVLFADIDFAQGPSFWLYILCTLILLPLFVGFGIWEWGNLGIVWGIGVSLYAVPKLANALLKIWEDWLGRTPVKIARERIAAYVKQHPGSSFDLYLTPAGMRVLALHKTFDPAGEDARDLFKQFKTDPLYVRMCTKQRCFRARLTPKPWRVHLRGHMRPRPGVWPVHPDQLHLRESWIRRYTRASNGYASCRFLETLGIASVDPAVEAVRAEHDRLSLARQGLPIA